MGAASYSTYSSIHVQLFQLKVGDGEFVVEICKSTAVPEIYSDRLEEEEVEAEIYSSMVEGVMDMEVGVKVMVGEEICSSKTEAETVTEEVEICSSKEEEMEICSNREMVEVETCCSTEAVRRVMAEEVTYSNMVVVEGTRSRMEVLVEATAEGGTCSSMSVVEKGKAAVVNYNNMLVAAAETCSNTVVAEIAVIATIAEMVMHKYMVVLR